MTPMERKLIVLIISSVYFIIVTPNHQQCNSYVITTNKMRYSTNQMDKMASSDSFPSHMVQNFGPIPTHYDMSNGNNNNNNNNNYKINQVVMKQSGSTKSSAPPTTIINLNELDSEDKSLLDKFYGETRGQDPLVSDYLTLENLWDEANKQELEKLNALLDLNPKQYHQLNQQTDNLQTQQQVNMPQLKHTSSLIQAHNGDWTVDQELIDQSKILSSIQMEMAGSQQAAQYSPSLKLLTSYDPISEANKLLPSGQERGLRSNRIVGATVYGQNEDTKPNISSKSPVEAIKLHDDLMSDAPHDGKVRVRMYFHRAIHDDAKLYGTGPWRYWGHGWGVEFGYDPRKADKNDFYQKGYTIERAFGRDFCKDRKNCRPPDPDFFKGSINKVKEYNEESQPAVEIKPFVDKVKLSRGRRNNLAM